MPVELYDRAEELVKGRGKPSWGQLVAWTCQTRQQEVVDEVLRQLRPADGLVPRGPNRRGRGATQVTARFTLDEQDTFAQTRGAAAAAVTDSDLPADDAHVTATIVVIAALEVATEGR
ncbi:MAG: hypothetical protein L0H79_16130 [Intrasporangium sp.]|uniref:hypothetical protein n=1 Tax=Intrasporangium sp. TaxID=1925024 RepID=UPI00264880A1|nr:hypothetical protein [Intrasporangium sp.]MDN5797265.1 hypothetical protein [Intrasporangium sp.]